MDKLYVVVRKDLPTGDQAVQSVHVALEYAAEHSDWTAWRESSNCIALLAAENERELELILVKAKDRGIKCSFFRESDLDNSMTAIALEPGRISGRLCGRLPLALPE